MLKPYDRMGMHKTSTGIKIKDGDTEIPESTHESFDALSGFVKVVLLVLSESHPARKEHGLRFQWKLVDIYGRLFSSGFNMNENSALTMAWLKRLTVLEKAVANVTEPPEVQDAKTAADMFNFFNQPSSTTSKTF